MKHLKSFEERKLWQDYHRLYASSLYLAGYTLQELGQYDEALIHYDKALENERELYGEESEDFVDT